MLSPDIELSGLDARHWRNWWRLLAPPRVLARPSWALAVLDNGRPIKLVIGGADARGSIDPEAAPLPGLTEKALATWAKTLGVSAVVAVDRKLLGELSAEIEAALRPDQDGIAQSLLAFKAIKKRAGHGLWTEPALLELLPAPSFDPLQRTFDLLVSDNTAMLAYVIEDDRSRVHASIIAEKRDGDLVRASTHRAVADLVAEPGFARTWDKSYKRVLDAVEERFAKPSIGLFVERATLMRIL